MSKVVKKRTDVQKGKKYHFSCNIGSTPSRRVPDHLYAKVGAATISAACAKLRLREEGKAGTTLMDCGFCQRDLGDEIGVAAAAAAT